MTAEQKMKAIVEAAGEPWHYRESGGWFCGCKGCGDGNVPFRETVNPSPTDLNALFRLAEKLDLHVWIGNESESQPLKTVGVTRFLGNCIVNSWKASAETTATALLNALYEAVKEK